MPDIAAVAMVEDYHPKRRFQPVRFKNIALDTTHAYLVKNLIPREGLVIVWGPPKCGKSFLIFDLTLHIALGWTYRGRRVDPGPVVYIACEGERGFGARTEAFREAKLSASDEADPPFYLLTTRLDLVADNNALAVDIKSTMGEGGCSAIIVDTLNRTLAGSESSDEDMSAYVKAADRLREDFHCAVIIIHHCGINGERPRGHTSLTGAADAQIAVKRDGADRIVATVEYMKDGPEGDEILSRLEVVEVGTDEDGDAITSCVIVPVADGEQHRSKAPLRLSAKNRIALDLLQKAIAEVGLPAPSSAHVPPQAIGITVETWRSYFRTGTADDGQTPNARKKAFQRAREALQSAKTVNIWDDFVWVVTDA
jgi:hypothetical protein